MPLAFDSLSHGRVVFGFYNIETDGLLLDRHFFFCTDFCGAVAKVAAQPRAEMPGWTCADAEAVGDLMGAIHGTRHVGLLGAVYRRWPFPDDPAAFRQRLAGHENRPAVETLLAEHARPGTLVIERRSGGVIGIGDYAFSAPQFRDLMEYVWRGGYPTWEGFERGQWPACATAMLEAWGGV
ncbi:MAG: hypothetical protein H3C38_13750 [Rhodospirillales bacterium]|nr:hypothetical protein [Rhodospirillales bacterium]